MEILGVGPLEFFLILVVALLVFGPNDIAKAGRTIGRFLRKVVLSVGWQALRKFWQELRGLPNDLMREAGLEETERVLSPRALLDEVKMVARQGEDGEQGTAGFSSGVSGHPLKPWMEQSPQPGGVDGRGIGESNFAQEAWLDEKPGM